MDLFMKHQHDAVFRGDDDYVNNMEMKERDLIKQLEKMGSSNIAIWDHNSPLVDCRLTLGPSKLTSNELLYMPTNCHNSRSQVTTRIGSSIWNGYEGSLPTSNSFAAYGNSLTVEANGCKMPMDFHVNPNVVMKNMQGSNFFQSKENVGNGKEEGITTTKKCCFCQTTTTPLWRNGPKGYKSLCNACGIRYKKKERKMLAAAGSVASGSTLNIHDGGKQDNHAHRFRNLA